MSQHLSRLIDLESWVKSLPSDFAYRVLVDPDELKEQDVCMRRYDIYSSVEIAQMCNLQSCACITLHRALVEVLSKPSPKPSSTFFLPISYGHLLTSNTVIQEMSHDI